MSGSASEIVRVDGLIPSTGAGNELTIHKEIRLEDGQPTLRILDD